MQGAEPPARRCVSEGLAPIGLYSRWIRTTGDNGEDELVFQTSGETGNGSSVPWNGIPRPVCCIGRAWGNVGCS